MFLFTTGLDHHRSKCILYQQTFPPPTSPFDTVTTPHKKWELLYFICPPSQHADLNSLIANQLDAEPHDHLVLRFETIHDLPRLNSHNNMNTNNFFCPIHGCLHSRTGIDNPFSSQTVLLHHLNSTSHVSTHSMVNHSNSTALGIYSCCAPSCPSSPKTIFSSLHALNDHCVQAHPPHAPTPSTKHIITRHQPQLSLHSLYPTSPHLFTSPH
jgi:hypothetical protein